MNAGKFAKDLDLLSSVLDDPSPYQNASYEQIYDMWQKIERGKTILINYNNEPPLIYSNIANFMKVCLQKDFPVWSAKSPVLYNKYGQKQAYSYSAMDLQDRFNKNDYFSMIIGFAIVSENHEILTRIRRSAPEEFEVYLSKLSDTSAEYLQIVFGRSDNPHVRHQRNILGQFNTVINVKEGFSPELIWDLENLGMHFNIDNEAFLGRAEHLFWLLEYPRLPRSITFDVFDEEIKNEMISKARILLQDDQEYLLIRGDIDGFFERSRNHGRTPEQVAHKMELSQEKATLRQKIRTLEKDIVELTKEAESIYDAWSKSELEPTSPYVKMALSISSAQTEHQLKTYERELFQLEELYIPVLEKYLQA